MEKERVYAFFDPISKDYYFHDPIRNKVMWNEPEGVDVYDGVTNEPFASKVAEKIPSLVPGDRNHGLQRVCLQIPKIIHNRKVSQDSFFPGLELELDKLRAKRRQSKLRELVDTEKEKPRTQRVFDTLDVGTSMRDFANTIANDRNLVNVTEWAKENLRGNKRSWRKKSDVRYDELLSYDENLSSVPLLNNMEKQQKNAVKLFMFALAYGKKKNDKPITTYVELIWNNRQTINEAYVQVIKLLTNTPSVEIQYQMWKLMLVLTTLFLASGRVSDLVKQFLSKAAFSSDKEEAKRAQLCYLRYYSNSYRGGSVENLPDATVLQKIPDQITSCTKVIGITLLELMWRQKQDKPKLSIPFFLLEMCKVIIDKGGLKSPDTFTVSGNKKGIDDLVSKIDIGDSECLQASNLHDLAYVFKWWLRLLPIPVVPSESVTMTNVVEAAERIPGPNKETLAYIVGFLKEYIQEQPDRRTMLCMMFGSSLVRLESSDPIMVKEMSDLSRDFLETLIDNWDVSWIYPSGESTA